METVEDSTSRPNQHSEANPSIGLLPRPCSMPSFDRNTESARKRNLQTLPFKRSAKRGLDQKPWKSMSSSQGLFGTASPAFGTPSYPVHLDMIRASESGLSTSDVSNLSANEMNNNFLDSLIHEVRTGSFDSKKEGDLTTSKKNLGESLHSFSFAPGFSRGSFLPSPGPGLNASLNASWQFFNFIGGAEVGTVFPTTTRNPNKAIITIDGRTSKILVANEIAGKLFGYLNEELCGMKMSKLFTMKEGFKQDALLEQHIDTEGNIVMVSGKVVEAVDCDGNIIPVSLWMKRVHSDGDPRCVAIIEPVQRAVGSFLFNAEGTIVDCDSHFALFHGCQSPEEIVGESILNLIPAFMLPIPGHEIARSLKKQRATGKTRDNTRFPVSIQISEYDKEFHEVYLRRENPDEIQFSKFLYKGIVWVFSNISGLISVLPNGQIHSCNGNFSTMLFGFSEQELVGKDLTYLIPLFYDHVELAEDRSLKIPSISDDGEVQLDPKRNTAMSGNFAAYASSQSEGFSDVDSLLGNCEYLEDLKGKVDTSHSNSDKTTTSSLTIGSENLESENRCNLESIDESSASESSYLTPRPNGVQASSTPEKANAHPPGLTDQSDINDDVSEEKTETKIHEEMNEELTNDLKRQDSCTNVNILKESNAFMNINASNCSDLSSKGSGMTSASSCNKSCCVAEKKEIERADKELASEKAESCETENYFGDDSKVIFAESRMENVNSSKVSDDKHIVDILKTEKELANDIVKGKEQDIVDCENCNTCDISDSSSKGSVMKKMDIEEVPADIAGDKGSSHGTVRIDPKGYLHYDDKQEASVEEQSPVNAEYRGLPTSLKYDVSTMHGVSCSVDSSDSISHQRGNEFVDENAEVVLDRSHDFNSNDGEDEEGSKKDTNEWHPSQITSTPKLDRTDSQAAKRIFEGNFCGQAKHKDGSLLPIVFQIKQITLDRGQDIFCIWVSRDPEEQGEGSRLASQMLLTGSFNSTLNISRCGYFPDILRGVADLNRSLTEENYKGQYDERYLTVKSIGKGAFGFVKLAQRRSDGQEVVVKFIQKSKIVPSSWIEDTKLGKIPLEVSYLSKIDHPNVVKMFDVFENDEFFQVVMEKHGDGIDLFEFIDRQPALDEPLCAYMFKQVVAAVSYLHERNILHRDVKDENIIVDRQFTLKLIDFGSAVFMEPGKLFSTFCGTVEYCSPEVLLGNKYHGPELEVWSMGITLYTLVFGENPFFDVEETIKAELHPPFRVSSELMFLICWMLHSEPGLRATVKDIATYRWLNQKVDVSLYDYDTIFAEEREDYYAGSEDRSPSSADYDDQYARYDDEYLEETEYVAENERLEQEYVRYFQRQASFPDTYDREHGASF